jgi:hypothetical protein
MWTYQTVIALLAAIGGPMVAVGVFLQRINHMARELEKLAAMVTELRESRYRQGKRLGRVEGWISASDGIQEGRPPPLHSTRHDTRGLPIVVPKEDSGGSGEHEGGE